MNILVMNLTRFGDLLQTAAAVRALAEGGGGKNKIGIICLENFTAGAELLPEVTDIFPVPAAKIMALLNREKQPAHQKTEPRSIWLNGLTSLHRWVEDVRGRFAPDMVCNLSPTTAASLLSRLLADKAECNGFVLDEFGFSHTTSPWASFILGASSSRGTSPYNIVDLFRKVVRTGSVTSDASLMPVTETALNAMRQRLFQIAPEPPAGFVTLQLGASADVRRWPVPSFTRIGDALWQEFHFLPVLLGTKGEMPLAEEYAANARSPFISLMGQTDLMGLAAALTLSSLCISNDTGTLHLASGLNVPVLGIYLATAQPWDTGPYTENNCSIEPDLACHPCNFGISCPNAFACHTAISPEIVLSLASSKLRENRWDAANFAGTPSCLSQKHGARIWESCRDDHCFSDLRSLSGHEQDSRTQWMRLQRHLYRQFFDEKDDISFVPPAPKPPCILAPEHAEPLAHACEEILALYDALLQQAEMLNQNPISLVRDRFSRTWQRLATSLRAQPDFAAIAFNWQTESMELTDIKNTLPLVRQYREFFLALREFLQ